MPDRRAFIASALNAAVVLPVLNSRAVRRLGEAAQTAEGRAPASLAADEDYWGEIQRAFDVDRTVINLNNGGCSPAPRREETKSRREVIGSKGWETRP